MEEQRVSVWSGWGMLVLAIVVALAAPVVFVRGAMWADSRDVLLGVMCMVGAGIILAPLAFFLFWGLFILQPNEARVLVLFGRYVGTVRDPGFHWANSFSVIRGGTASVSHGQITFASEPSKRRYRVSLRARNFETQHLKVNDQRGNPVEIAAVVVWHVEDTAKALFDVNDYENYVSVQSETAVRHLASSYPYDHSEDGATSELTLRGNSDAVNATLKQELQERLGRVGVAVDDARLTHLAYSPEIAGVMLRRQQAEAVIAARRQIVAGAVSMVEMALAGLAEKNLVQLDDERRAAMVSNLLVVLCGEVEAQPVINTGSLYQ